LHPKWNLAGGKTLLHHAVECGSLSSIETLLKKGLAIKSVDDKGRNVFHTAALLGRYFTIENLWEALDYKEIVDNLTNLDKENLINLPDKKMGTHH
jgi:ankyrin repeat protein